MHASRSTRGVRHEFRHGNEGVESDASEKLQGLRESGKIGAERPMRAWSHKGDETRSAIRATRKPPKNEKRKRKKQQEPLREWKEYFKGRK